MIWPKLLSQMDLGLVMGLDEELIQRLSNAHKPLCQLKITPS